MNYGCGLWIITFVLYNVDINGCTVTDIIVSPSPVVASVMSSPVSLSHHQDAGPTLLPQNIDAMKEADTVNSGRFDADMQHSVATIDSTTQTTPTPGGGDDVSRPFMCDAGTQTDQEIVAPAYNILPTSKDTVCSASGERALDVVRSILDQLLSSQRAIAALYGSGDYGRCTPVGELVRELTDGLNHFSSDLVWANLMYQISTIDQS